MSNLKTFIFYLFSSIYKVLYQSTTAFLIEDSLSLTLEESQKAKMKS